MKWIRCQPKDVPSAPGVYQVFLDGQLAYVGLSGAMRIRFQAHWFGRNGEKTFKGVAYEAVEVRCTILRCEDGRRILERQLVEKYNPPLNVKLRRNK